MGWCAIGLAQRKPIANGGFTIGDCRGLAPLYIGDFVLQLREAGLVLDDPSKARPGTYYWEGDEIWMVRGQVVYRLAVALEREGVSSEWERNV